MHRRTLFFTQNKLLKYLVGYYKFDNNLKDSATSPINLVMSSGTAQYSPAKIGNGFDFNTNTVRTAVLRPSPAGKYTFSNGTSDVPFSFSFWMNYRGQGGTSFNHIFGKNSYGSTGVGYEYRIAIENSGVLSVIKFSLGVQANSRGIATTTAIPTNTFVHVAITDDALGNTLIYVNGVLQTTTISNNGSGFVRFSNTSALEGFGNLPGVAAVGNWFNGILDEFSIFKGYALTQDDINFIYNSGNGKELK